MPQSYKDVENNDIEPFTCEVAPKMFSRYQALTNTLQIVPKNQL